MIEWDTETKIFLALARLDKQDALFSSVLEISAAAKVSATTTRRHLMRLHYTRGVLEFCEGQKTMWRCNEAGAHRANQLRLLKPRQRLIWSALIRKGGPSAGLKINSIKRETGLNKNGISQSLGAMSERGLVYYSVDVWWVKSPHGERRRYPR